MSVPTVRHFQQEPCPLLLASRTLALPANLVQRLPLFVHQPHHILDTWLSSRLCVSLEPNSGLLQKTVR